MQFSQNNNGNYCTSNPKKTKTLNIHSLNFLHILLNPFFGGISWDKPKIKSFAKKNLASPKVKQFIRIFRCEVAILLKLRFLIETDLPIFRMFCTEKLTISDMKINDYVTMTS